MERINIQQVKENPDNPRSIQKHKFNKLVKSIKEFPEMLKLRPIVVDDNNVVLGGNMRLKASIEAGLKEVWIAKASDLTPEQQKEFIIKDNSSFGDWDWDVLANEWDTEKINDWGVDLPILNEKLQVEKYAQPEIEITEEILEEHNYLVFTFDNQLDWQVAKEMFDIKTVAKPGYTDTYMQKGVGRVKKGRELIDLFNKK
jgi:hypothetical protein